MMGRSRLWWRGGVEVAGRCGWPLLVERVSAQGPYRQAGRQHHRRPPPTTHDQTQLLPAQPAAYLRLSSPYTSMS